MNRQLSQIRRRREVIAATTLASGAPRFAGAMPTAFPAPTHGVG